MNLAQQNLFTRLLHPVAAVLLLGGCAATPYDTAGNAVTIERVSTPDAKPWRVEVNKARNGNGITVSGELEPRWYLKAPPKGHIDVEVIAPDGKTLLRRSAIYHLKHLSRKLNSYTFSVALSAAPPKNSIIRVTPHAAALCEPMDSV